VWVGGVPLPTRGGVSGGGCAPSQNFFIDFLSSKRRVLVHPIPGCYFLQLINLNSMETGFMWLTPLSLPIRPVTSVLTPVAVALLSRL